MRLTKRQFLFSLLAAAATGITGMTNSLAETIEKLVLSKAEWKKRLTPDQFDVLRRAGTEPAGSSPLNHEKRVGLFHCAGCDLSLFESVTKFESGDTS